MDGYFLPWAVSLAPDRTPPWASGLREWTTLLAYLRMRQRVQQKRAKHARDAHAWALHQQGLSWANIGRELAISAQAAQLAALRAERSAHGVDRPKNLPYPSLASPLTEAETNILHWREAGVTWIEIARRLGCALGRAQVVGQMLAYKVKDQQRRAPCEETSRQLAQARRLSLARAELSLQEAYLALLQSRGRAVVRSPVITVGRMARGQIPLYPPLVYGMDKPPRDNETRDAIQEVLDDTGS